MQWYLVGGLAGREFLGKISGIRSMNIWQSSWGELKCILSEKISPFYALRQADVRDAF